MTPQTEPGSRGGFAALDHCVHCGFCLQACPTFLATGDEADSPRGRIELMRALERGDASASDPFVATHLDRCLGCRGCEPVCPSGVGYGHALEAARELLTNARGVGFFTRFALALLTSAATSPVVYGLARALRASRVPDRLAGWGRVSFAMGMLAATRPRSRARGNGAPPPQGAPKAGGTDAALFRGCVMNGLFGHVHDATARTLAVNGYSVHEAPAQVCCGALHVRAGLRQEAQTLARRNILAFGADDSFVAVNSAGCGAMLKEYDALLPTDPAARSFAHRVKDVSELLATSGPVPGAPLDVRVAYDPPCHLLHAQRVADAPLALLRAIPVLQLVSTPDAAQCCGSAGIYSLAQPEMARAVLRPKLASLAAAAPAVVATGNPGCLMQLGAGLRAAGLPAQARHPIELLDESYRRAGFYG
ncbi:MAG TPA: (Fe-S)-binding protein [Gemmatimonadales bacterium]|nr:(Fe-S)-binding protein [Gemmatimonadales bacterium]